MCSETSEAVGTTWEHAQGHHQLSRKSDENKSFEPNQIAPSIYIMRELCYFSRDQWKIKKHLLWGICFYDILIYREASQPMRDINTLQCVDILHWRAFPIQDKSRHGLVKMTHSGDNWCCPWDLFSLSSDVFFMYSVKNIALWLKKDKNAKKCVLNQNSGIGCSWLIFSQGKRRWLGGQASGVQICKNLNNECDTG